MLVEFRKVFMVRVLSYFVLQLTCFLCNTAYCTDCCAGMSSADCLQHNGHISLNCLHGRNKHTNKHTYKTPYFVRSLRITFKRNSVCRPCCERINEDLRKQWSVTVTAVVQNWRHLTASGLLKLIVWYITVTLWRAEWYQWWLVLLLVRPSTPQWHGMLQQCMAHTHTPHARTHTHQVKHNLK
jgi:hypothetical protein